MAVGLTYGSGGFDYFLVLSQSASFTQGRALTVDREAAERLVREVLEALPGGARGMPGAALKSYLLDRVPDFNEVSLGFTSFTEFVRTVPGVEVVQQASDNFVTLAKSPSETVPVRTRLPRMRLVRKEVWDAIIQTDPKESRFFDRTTGAIHRAGEAHDGSPYVDYEKEPARYVRIPNIDSDSQHRICVDFISKLPEGPERLTLSKEVEQRPFAFIDLYRRLRNTPEMLSLWRRFRSEVVAEKVGQWAKQSGIDPNDLVFIPKYDQEEDRNRKPDPASVKGDDYDLLRAWIRSAVDDMTPADLISFRFPATFVLRLLREKASKS